MKWHMKFTVNEMTTSWKDMLMSQSVEEMFIWRNEQLNKEPFVETANLYNDYLTKWPLDTGLRDE